MSNDKELITFARSVIDRLRLSVDTNSALGNLSEWVSTYTKLDADTYFSFKDHEMQEAIINDTSSRQVIQKCSQVGASELSARKSCGILAISKGVHLIYAFPSSRLAIKFSTSRIQPIIDSSPMLSQMRNKAAKGSEMLGLGSSFLHFGGTTGAATGAISIPASYVIIDELDFCDQEVVGKYESRLKHAKEDIHGRKGMVCKLSTPTIEDYGINKEFKKSDQKHYNVICDNCSTTFAPDYFRDIVIPGYEKNLIELTPEDVLSGSLDIKNAYMACPCCKKDVWEELCTPSKRKWVAKYPNAIVSGWQIHPWDVPKVNSIPSIIMQLTEFENIADYYNFAIGIPYADNNNSFLLGVIDEGSHSTWLTLKKESDFNHYCIGVDVGRTSHITVGYKDVTGKLHVTYMERFTATKEKPLGERVSEIIKVFRANTAVIDAMPDFSTVHHVAKKFPYKTILACEYSKSKPKGKLTNFVVDEDSNLVSAYRTGVIKDFLMLHNSGSVLYPNRHESMAIDREIKELKTNLTNLKKVKKLDQNGDDLEAFIKVGKGNDHYAHALTYLNMACNISSELTKSSSKNIAPVRVTSFTTYGQQSNKVAKPISLVN